MKCEKVNPVVSFSGQHSVRKKATYPYAGEKSSRRQRDEAQATGMAEDVIQSLGIE